MGTGCEVITRAPGVHQLMRMANDGCPRCFSALRPNLRVPRAGIRRLLIVQPLHAESRSLPATCVANGRWRTLTSKAALGLHGPLQLPTCGLVVTLCSKLAVDPNNARVHKPIRQARKEGNQKR